MDKETANYIVNFYTNLLTVEEKLAIKHINSTIKLGLDETHANNSTVINMYKKRGWLTENENILSLLTDGYDAFLINVAKRVLSYNSHQIFLNNCP